MRTTSKIAARAAILAAAPAVMLAGLVYHPFIGELPDHQAVAAAAGLDTGRWAAAHLLVAVGSGLMAVAFLAVRAWLREAGEDRWSAVAVPFAVMAGALYAVLPGMEFAVLAAVETGGDAAAAQAALDPWFLPLLVTAAAVFAIGAVCFAVAILRSGLLSRPLAATVAGALVVMGLARFVPHGLAQLYVNGLAGLVAFWPLAHAIWTRPETHGAREPRSMPAG